jgi:hypothetical protein
MGQRPAVMISCTKASVERTRTLYIIRPLCVLMILRSQVVRQSEAEESSCRCTANQFGEGKRTLLDANEPSPIRYLNSRNRFVSFTSPSRAAAPRGL